VELDRVSLAAVRRSKRYALDMLRYHWDYYACLAQQRVEESDAIKKSLLGAAEGPFEFNGWQRVVDYRYSLAPLSAIGSVITDPGGRFNIGDVDKTRFTRFAGLYIASNESTALVEKFGADDKDTGLSNLDFALRPGRSYTCVSVTGRMEAVLDLRSPNRLEPFVEIIKAFKLPPDLAGRASALGVPPPTVVDSVTKLVGLVMAAAWRDLPMQADIPAGSQIFGQLVWNAGIEGIVYPSVETNSACIVVFPENLASSSFVRLDHEPPVGVAFRQLDGTNYREFI
jgi:hypothetical protein